VDDNLGVASGRLRGPLPVVEHLRRRRRKQ
jgi:hypothetical protein